MRRLILLVSSVLSLTARAQADAVEQSASPEAGERVSTLACRPTIACMAEIVPKGFFEVEAGYGGRASAGALAHSGQLLLKYSLLDTVQLQLATNNLFLVGQGLAPRAVDGVMPGLKVKFNDQGEVMPSNGISVHVAFPTHGFEGAAQRTIDASAWWYISKDVGPVHGDINFAVNVFDVTHNPTPQGLMTLALSSSAPCRPRPGRSSTPTGKATSTRRARTWARWIRPSPAPAPSSMACAPRCSAFSRRPSSSSCRSQGAQYGLMGLVVLMVAAVVAYGFRLQRTLSRKQEEIDRANEGMRLVLDNVEQGLLTVDLSARIVGERSEVVGRWLSQATPGTLLWSAIDQADKKCAQWLQAGWSLVTEDLMPLEVAIEQLPKRLRVGEQVLSISYRPSFEGATLSRVLLVFTDVTASVRSERLELQQRETLSMFERVMRDRSGFLEAFDDCARLVNAVVRLGDRDLIVVRRQVHTLKGNAACIGLTSLAATCHELEDSLAESAGDLSKPMADRLQAEWDALSTRLHSLMGQHSSAEVVVEPEAFEALLDAVTTEAVPRASVRSMVESLRMEPASRRLERLAEQAQSVAGRLMKGPLHVAIESNGLRFEKERWTPFFSSLVHLVRNAVDHGLEPLSDRAALGKGVGTLTLSTKVTAEQVELVIADDGRGLDLERLVAVAKARGLNVTDGLESMFLDGVSTREQVTEVSGRGVGMAAVKAAAEAMGGRVTVTTETGKGTTFRFLLPLIGVGAELSRQAARADERPRQQVQLPAHQPV